ncbi:MAG: Gfo/Idh/MocA family protein, partial [Thermoplasmata archaeon]
MKKLNVGIVGCGMITKERHIPAYKRMKDKVNLKAVCDLDEDLAKETAKENNIPKAYKDSSEMYEKENLDIVDICVPPHVHAPVAIEAIENGAHIIMEKPMATTVKDCNKMLEAAEEHDVEICTIHNVRYHPAFIEAKEKVENGEIGEFLGMRILLSTPKHHMMDMKDHWYHDLPGGVLGETGPH